MILVGPAGWSYPDWAGVVYPTRKGKGFHPLRYLAPFIDFVEVNSSFYAFPTAHAAEGWVRAVADLPAFRFVVKVHQDFTHGTAEPTSKAAATFTQGIAPLADARKLTALLMQFPVTFRRTATSVDRLRRLRGLFSESALVLEVRHRTWFDPEGIEVLRPLGVSLAHIDLPAAKDHPPEEHETLGPLGYLRLHGRNRATWFAKGAGRDQRYDYLYPRSEVTALAERAQRIAAKRAETLVVTNNHYAGKGMANTIEIRSLLRGGPVPAPAPLVEAFPHLRNVATVSGQMGLF